MTIRRERRRCPSQRPVAAALHLEGERKQLLAPRAQENRLEVPPRC
jgi:hypothetical protein